MSKKRPVAEDDDDVPDMVMPMWSFSQAPPPPKPPPPLPRLSVVAPEEQTAMSRAWDSLIQDDGSSAPLPVLSSTARTIMSTQSAPGRKLVHQPVMLSRVPADVVDALTTYDKPERSQASPDTRKTNLFNRVYRADDKVQEAASSGRPPDNVDDSLMRDMVGTYAQDYRRHAEYKVSERPLPSLRAGNAPRTDARLPPSLQIARADVGHDDEEDEDEDPEADGIQPDPRTQLAMDLNDDDQDEVASRMFVAPMRRVPNTADSQTIKTFSEYTGPSPATGQFTDNIRHIRGRERGVYMEIRDNEEIYNVVKETLDRPLANMEIQRIAVERNWVIPDPPKVSKAEIQDGLCAHNPMLGERPCVKGVKCASWKMCLRRMEREPERYKGAKPFVCKEFYFGDRGAEIQAALREGRPLAEVQGPELIMCVMCHLRVVTKWYKKYHAGLHLEPPHILHSFQVTAGAPGGYPVDVCLLGDKTFCGVIAPFIRHVPENYIWESSSGVTERDPITGHMVTRQGPSIQRWLERDHMDFQ